MKLTLRNINKHYGKHRALININADFTVGLNALLGPNGAGKTTLMNIITGNILPDKNKSSMLYWNDEDIYKLGKNYRAIIGYMPQQQGIYDSFTAIRFLSYIAALKGLTTQEARDQIPRLLETVELTNASKKKLGSYSGGMKQRILLAQALLGDPKLIILDEPTAGLDPKQRVMIRKLIRELANNRIVIVSTHIVSDIESIADDVTLLKDGSIIARGTVEQLVLSIHNNSERNLENVYMQHFGNTE